MAARHLRDDEIQSDFSKSRSRQCYYELIAFACFPSVGIKFNGYVYWEFYSSRHEEDQ